MRNIIRLSTILFLINISYLNAETIVTDSTSDSTIDSNITSTTKLTSPPPSAITPQINVSNSDLCTVGIAGAVQTQILGISMGTVYTEENCIRLKLSKQLYNLGMRVAAVSALCADRSVFMAMKNSGTPCPIDGLTGQSAADRWEEVPERWPDAELNDKGEWNEGKKSQARGIGAVGGLFALLLLLL
tara:strand:+ start:25549 stop:26109 length:561 start_codon:yes stop_codon:yes gene_type:complete